ncbi:hypothetical protein H131_08398 [Lysinibacillus sphaericus OT4b.31]|uniref:Uncharacterized protein n=1 Tax=Lysinibacillus sphaericus OT4b.31 TaxID=1285586 RepID=R7ZG77_LYSSH|nr:hypothetical protein H131_08398 [Lysinibacillus sphaericus OT4b.31]
MLIFAKYLTTLKEDAIYLNFWHFLKIQYSEGKNCETSCGTMSELDPVQSVVKEKTRRFIGGK